jgi:hypothetical protein
MTDDPYLAGRLIHWGLQGRARPAQEEEYRRLLEKYLDQSEFRELTRELARGLGLQVLDAGPLGFVLGTSPESTFAYKPSEFRNTPRAEDRLIDGLVQVAVAATVFPRTQDLQEDPGLARPPVTVDEVDATLRGLCDRLGEKAKTAPDPEATGLYEAWRVYQQRPSVKETGDDRAAARSTRRVIEIALDRLTQLGCFTNPEEKGAYQPTWRYQVLVKELAAQSLWTRIREALPGEAKD